MTELETYRLALMRIARAESGMWGTIAHEALRAGAKLADGFEFGRPAVNERGFECCGKPQGCTNVGMGCAFLQHPYKRFVRGEISLEELQRRTAA